MTTEPVRTAVVALVTAALVLLVAFGVAFTADQIAAIGAFVVAAFGVGEIVRARVTPTGGE